MTIQHVSDLIRKESFLCMLHSMMEMKETERDQVLCLYKSSSLSTQAG